jgi:hypothetical protein
MILPAEIDAAIAAGELVEDYPEECAATAAWVESDAWRALRFEPLNLLIGTNASGKSNLLDALRLLSEGMRAKDFTESVADRGGITHLAWKGHARRENPALIQLASAHPEPPALRCRAEHRTTQGEPGARAVMASCPGQTRRTYVLADSYVDLDR